MLLLALLSHLRRPAATEARPRQERLAALLGCSVRTVQRGLARLETAGLIARRLRRDPQGRLCGLRYDLAGLLALLPAPRSGPTPGPWVSLTPRAAREAADPSRDPSPPKATPAPPPTRHPRRAESESESDAARRNNTAPVSPDGQMPPSAVPTSPVVEALIAQGVLGRIAAALVARHGEQRCRQALDAVAVRPRIASPPAWLVRCLSEGWDLTPPAAVPSVRPPSQRPYAPPRRGPAASLAAGSLAAASPAAASPAAGSVAAGSVAADPLAGLPPAALCALERAARAQLLAELPALRESLARGKSRDAVRGRMRLLLAAPHDDTHGKD